MAHDVFISYSTKDRTIADAVCARAEQHGIRCWIAPRDATPGEGYGASIMQAIRHSRIFVLLHSGNSDASKHVRNEVHAAHNADVVILPVRIAQFVPSDEIDFFISRQHWLDAITPPRERRIEELCARLRTLLDREPLPPPPPPPPPRRLRTALALGFAALLLSAAAYFLVSGRVAVPDRNHEVISPVPDPDYEHVRLKEEALKQVNEGDLPTAVQRFDGAAASARKLLAEEPNNQTLRGELTEILRLSGYYRALSDQFEQSQKDLDAARDEANAMAASAPARADLQWNITHTRAHLAHRRGDREQEAALLQDALEQSARLPPIAGLAKGVNYAAYVTRKTQAEFAQEHRQFAVAASALDEAARIAKAIIGVLPDDRWWRAELAAVTRLQGATHYLQGDYAAAATAYESALAQATQFDAGSWAQWFYQNEVGTAVVAQNRHEQAKTAFTAALRLAEALPGFAGLPAGINAQVTTSLRHLAGAVAPENKPKQLIELYARAVAVSRQMSQARPMADAPRQELAEALRNEGYYRFWTQNERESGRRLLAEAYRESGQLTTPDDGLRYRCAFNLALALRNLGRNAEAMTLMDEARQNGERLAGVADLPAGNNGATAASYRYLGAYAWDDGKPDEARTFLQKALAIAERMQKAAPDDASVAAELTAAREELRRIGGGS